MADTIRVFYRGQIGRLRENFNWPPITDKSTVIITAAEWRPAGGIFGPEVGRYNLSDADIYVTNVGPHKDEGAHMGGVEFILHVNGDSPLDVVVAITVLEPYEQFQAA